MDNFTISHLEVDNSKGYTHFYGHLTNGSMFSGIYRCGYMHLERSSQPTTDLTHSWEIEVFEEKIAPWFSMIMHPTYFVKFFNSINWALPTNHHFLN